MKNLFIDGQLQAEVAEYHAWHKDRNVKCVKILKDPEGFEAVLVRFTDAQGVKRSAIDTAHDYVTELASVLRTEEAALVDSYIRGELG